MQEIRGNQGESPSLPAFPFWPSLPLLVVAASVLAFIVGLYLAQPVCLVTLSSETRTDRVALAPSATLSLSFVNSIYDQSETDVFELDGGCRLTLTRLEFGGGGAADYGSDFTRREGAVSSGKEFIASSAGRTYMQFVVRADASGRFRLTAGERAWRLDEWAGDGARVQVAAAQVPRALGILVQ